MSIQYQAQNIKRVIEYTPNPNEYDLREMQNSLQYIFYEVGATRPVASFPTINDAITYLIVCMMASGHFGA